MESMNVFSLKSFGSAFSGGTVLMYEKVDALIDINGLIGASGIKLCSVPLVKALVTGVLNSKRSVSQI